MKKWALIDRRGEVFAQDENINALIFKSVNIPSENVLKLVRMRFPKQP